MSMTLEMKNGFLTGTPLFREKTPHFSDDFDGFSGATVSRFIIERLISPVSKVDGKEERGFSLGISREREKKQTTYTRHGKFQSLPEDILAIDFPRARGSTRPLENFRELVVSHADLDHFPPDKKTLLGPLDYDGESLPIIHIHPETLLVWKYMNGDNFPFDEKKIRFFKDNESFIVAGLGKVTPIPFSHSSLHMHGFLIETFDGNTILIVPDQRDGRRTQNALLDLEKLFGHSNLSHESQLGLLVGDGTNIGNETPTLEQYEQRVKNAFIRSGISPVLVYLRATDYGLISLMKSALDDVADNYELFVTPELGEFLLSLHWDTRYHLPLHILENPYQQIPRNKLSVTFYDRPYTNPFEDRLHPIPCYHLYDTSMKHNPKYNQNHVEVVVPLGWSGHDSRAIGQLLEKTGNPYHLAFSHPPAEGTASHTHFRSREVELQKRGQTYIFSNKR